MIHRRGRVLLIRRKFPPNKGKWSLPGGLVELGESAQQAAVREVFEETGLKVEVEGLLDVATDLHLDARSRVKYHFILVDFVAHPVGGTLKLNDESTAHGWFQKSELARLKMTTGTRAALEATFSLLESKTLTAGRLAGRRSRPKSYCFSLLPLSHHSR